MKTLISMAVLCAATLAAPARAADNDDDGVIFGVGVGRLSASAVIIPDVINFDRDTTTYRGFLGYRFNRYFSIEGSYTDVQEVTQHYGDVLSISLDASGWQAAVVGTYWFGEHFNIFGRAGNNWYDVEATVSDGFQSASVSGSEDAFGWGAGIGAVWDRALFRLEYEDVDFDDTDTSQLSLSIAWRL